MGHSVEAEARRVGVSGEVTRLIRRCRAGDEAAQEKLFEAVYDDLRRLAAAYMRDERDSHTLPPTGLVHEAYLRMERGDSAVSLAENRRHFFSIAARAMRRILVEHARFHAAARRPSSRDAEPLDEQSLLFDGESPLLEVLAVEGAMERLRAANERQAQVVELRYFAGLEESEVADVLGLSRATVSRDWRVARLMLRGFLEPAEDRAPEPVPTS
ncbi:MAG: ECF-type sigma factor [Holophagales bacterium]|nr:ECF-type sigma factor [Holophagales bacterium]